MKTLLFQSSDFSKRSTMVLLKQGYKDRMSRKENEHDSPDEISVKISAN